MNNSATNMLPSVVNNAYMNWSGGKDSALALYHVLQQRQYNIRYLLTSMNAVHNRVSMHGVRRELMQQQAAAIGIPLTTVELPEQPGMAEYETIMQQKVQALKQDGCTHAIFGDIFLEDLKAYREQQLAAAGISCVFPLWQRDTTALVQEFIALGFKAVVVCVNEQYLDKGFCGRIIDTAFLNDLPAGVDPCGEHGEFHSFVVDGPVFSAPVTYTTGDMVYRTYAAPANADDSTGSTTGFYFCDLVP